MIDPAILEREVLQWPESERALLADRLLSSLSVVSAEVRAAWVNEAGDRLQAYSQGQIEAVDGAEAMRRLKNEFAK